MTGDTDLWGLFANFLLCFGGPNNPPSTNLPAGG